MATSGNSASTDVERENSRREEEVKRYWQSNERIYVNSDTFDACMPTIKDWLNVSCLVPYLMKHGLVTSPADTETITSPYLPPDLRQNNLLGLAKRCGEHGYFLLYMCIRDSRAENRHGHGSAVAALETHARSQNLRPPWENSSSNSHPENFHGPGFGPDGFDSSPAPRGPHSRPAPQGPQSSPDSHSSHSNSQKQKGNDTPHKGQALIHVQPSTQSINMSDEGPRGQDEIGSLPPGPTLPEHNLLRPLGKGEVRNLDPRKILQQELDSASSIQCPRTNPMLTPQLTSNTAKPFLVAGNRSSEGDEVEKDRTLSSRPNIQKADVQAPLGPSLTARVRDAISQGDIGSLFEKFENEVDADILSEADCENKSVFMEDVCRFSTACLNSRDSGKIGILLAGVSMEYSGDKPYAVCGFRLLDSQEAIRGSFYRLLERSMSVREGRGSGGTRPSCEDLTRMIQLHFVTPTCTDFSSAGLGSRKTVAVITVVPEWAICKNRLYHCRFVEEKSGRSGPLELWKRSEGSTVSVKPNKVQHLVTTLNTAFEKFESH